MKLEVKIPPLDDLNLKVDTQRLLDEAAEEMLRLTLTRFLAQESPDGNPWKPSRAALRRGGNTLFDTGHLFGSIHIFKSEDSRFIGTNVDYGKKHQQGIGVEKREFLGIGKSDMDTISQIVEARFKDFMR